MNQRDRLALGALVALLAIVGGAMLIPGSGWQSSAGSAPPPAAVTYREAVVGHPSSINPLTARTQVDRDLVSLLFRGLVKAGPDGKLEPDLAREWNVSEDGRTYTFYLSSQVRWEDGVSVTADDVVFTVGLAASPDYEGPLGAEWRGIEAKAISPHVVSVTLPASLGGFLRLATLPILPQHVLAGVGPAELADSSFSTRPIGNGPFRLLEIDVSHAVLGRVTAEGAAQSPLAESGSPGVSEAAAASPSAEALESAASPATQPRKPIGAIELRFFDTEAAAVAAFTAGNVDGVAGLKAGSVDSAALHSGSRLIRYPWASLTAVVLNQRESHPELRVKSVRRALLASIDRPAVLTRVIGGRGSLADAPLPVWSSWYRSAAVSVVNYTGSAAASDLSAAGWTQGRDGWMLRGASQAYVIKLLTLEEPANPTVYAVAQQVAADWRALGLQVSIVPASVKDYSEKLQSGQFDAAVVDYRLGLDPDISPLLLSTQIAPAGANLSGVADATLDRLLKTVRGTVDPEERQAAVSALEGYVTSNVLMLPICFNDYVFAVSDRVSSVAETEISDPSERYWDVLDWRLASDG